MTFSIGPGVRDAMAAAHDEPRSDESYVRDGISETYGRDGIYYYFTEGNVTRRLPFETGS